MLTILTGAGLLAADLRADIPFAFSIGQATMPAGVYNIAFHNSVLSVRAVDGHNGAMALTVPTLEIPKEHRNMVGGGSLIFQKYGNESFLAGFWLNGADSGHTLPAGKRQKELARQIKVGEAAAVAMNRK